MANPFSLLETPPRVTCLPELRGYRDFLRTLRAPTNVFYWFLVVEMWDEMKARGRCCYLGGADTFESRLRACA